MSGHARKLIEVADDQIRYLALRSEELQQETRVSIYVFSDVVRCLIYDMDVMRLPSIADLYKAEGMTALIDAVIKSQEDLSQTAQIYGDHAFLTFTLTDGQENRSRHSMRDLSNLTARARDNWSVAYLVPDRTSEAYLTRLGVSKGNIAIWDTSSTAGLIDAAKTIRAATDSFMTNRASGIRGTRNVFSTGVDAVNDQTVKSTLTPLSPNSYALYPVRYKTRIDDFVNTTGYRYQLGKGFYELSKTETIQPQKEVIVVDKQTGQAYGGREARNLIGLGSYEVRVKPDYNPKYKIFVQSTAPNRNLMPNTELLYKL